VGDWYHLVVWPDPKEPVPVTGAEPAIDEGVGDESIDAASALVAGVAHDLNNLLMVMAGCTHFLRAGDGRGGGTLGDAGPDDAAMLEEAIRRAAALTDRLASFGRRSARRTSVDDLGAIVRGLGPMLPRLTGEDIPVEVRAATDLLVEVDPARIEQLIMLVAMSARQLLPRGGSLRVDVTAEAADAAILAITASPRPGGSAAAGRLPVLGMVGRIAGEARGVLAVERDQLGATCLRVRLPRHRGDRPVVAEPRPVSVGGETVLLVEDDDGTRRILGRVLTSAGYRVLAASSVGAAITLVEQHGEPVNLVLSDVVLPDGSGRDVIEQARRRWPGLHALLASGYPDSVLVGYGLGASDVSRLAKPFTTSELLHAVRAAIDRTG